MEEKNVTIKDIAEAANVSPSTVSRVLNYDASLKVTTETRKLIFETADRMEYRPRKKNGPKEQRIGFYFGISPETEMEDTFYLELRSEIESLLKIDGRVLRSVTSEDTKKTVRQLDGVVCVGIFGEQELGWLNSLGKPLLFVDSNPDPDKYISVEFDLVRSTEKVLNYFLEMGHTKIGFIGGKDNAAPGLPEGNGKVDQRQYAFTEHLGRMGLFEERYMRVGTFTPQDGYRLFKDIMSKEDAPTALFIANDSLATGCYKAAHEMGIRIPDDVSLIGFNDLPSSQFMIPPLTTVRLNVNYMASLAAYVLTQILDKVLWDPIQIIIPSKLVLRESVRKLN